MSGRDLFEGVLVEGEPSGVDAAAGAGAPAGSTRNAITARAASSELLGATAAPLVVAVGELIAIADNGLTPLVLYAGQPGTATLRARTVIDLHGAHVGRGVVLAFEAGDPQRPIIMGVLRSDVEMPVETVPGQIEMEADGARLVVSAREQLVLRCGRARITLTHAGKVLIEGTYLSSRSSGVNRIKGGSVQIN